MLVSFLRQIEGRTDLALGAHFRPYGGESAVSVRFTGSCKLLVKAFANPGRTPYKSGKIGWVTAANRSELSAGPLRLRRGLACAPGSGSVVARHREGRRSGRRTTSETHRSQPRRARNGNLIATVEQRNRVHRTRRRVPSFILNSRRSSPYMWGVEGQASS